MESVTLSTNSSNSPSSVPMASASCPMSLFEFSRYCQREAKDHLLSFLMNYSSRLHLEVFRGGLKNPDDSRTLINLLLLNYGTMKHLFYKFPLMLTWLKEVKQLVNFKDINQEQMMDLESAKSCVRSLVNVLQALEYVETPYGLPTNSTSAVRKTILDILPYVQLESQVPVFFTTKSEKMFHSKNTTEQFSPPSSPPPSFSSMNHHHQSQSQYPTSYFPNHSLQTPPSSRPSSPETSIQSNNSCPSSPTHTNFRIISNQHPIMNNSTVFTTNSINFNNDIHFDKPWTFVSTPYQMNWTSNRSTCASMCSDDDEREYSLMMHAVEKYIFPV